MPERQYLAQIGRAVINRPFYNLRKITRTFTVNGGGLPIAQVNTEVLIDYGTADAEFTEALLVDRQMQQSSPEKSGYITGLTEIYQEFTADEKVSIGEDQIVRLEDGRSAMVRRYVCLASDAEDLAAEIGDIVEGRACREAKIIKHGVGAEIIETYISAGILAQSTDYQNNDALEIRSITYYNGVPETPVGFFLIGTSEQNPEGLPGRTYRFAKGTGEIDRQTAYNQSDDVGVTGVTVVTIRYLTSPAIVVDPTSSPGAGFVKVLGGTPSDRDGFRLWTTAYAKGTGLVAQVIIPRQDGLREVTNVSLGSRIAPTGEVLRDEWRIADGYKVFTVEAMQAADGGNVSGASLVSEDYVPFRYPGRLKPFVETYNSRKLLDVFKAPPANTDVPAMIKVTYQTSETIGMLTHPKWQPTSFATMRAQWVSLGDNPRNLVEPYPEYRSVSDLAVEVTASSMAPNDLSIFSQVVFGATTARIIVTGGPDDPSGNTYTLDARTEPAFCTSNGTQWWRRIVVEATIPAQDALPI